MKQIFPLYLFKRIAVVFHWGPQRTPGEPMGPHGNPGDPMGTQGTPGDPRGPQGKPAQGTPAEPWGSRLVPWANLGRHVMAGSVDSSNYLGPTWLSKTAGYEFRKGIF